METLLILVMGFSSLVSLYYLIREHKSYQLQLKINAELEKTLKEVDTLKNELLVEQVKLRTLAGTLNQSQPELIQQDTPLSDIRTKRWLN